MAEITFEDKVAKTPMARLAYLSVFKPSIIKAKKGSNQKESDAKYRCTFIFEGDVDLSELKKAAHNAAFEKWGPKENWPSKKSKKKNGKVVRRSLVKMPFKDGDEEYPDKPEFEGKLFLRADCTKKPKVCSINRDEKGNFIEIKEEDGVLKSGDFGRGRLFAMAYEVDGSYGVKFILNMLQKLKTGESLQGGASMNDAFDDEEFADYEDEEMNDAMESDFDGDDDDDDDDDDDTGY